MSATMNKRFRCCYLLFHLLTISTICDAKIHEHDIQQEAAKKGSKRLRPAAAFFIFGDSFVDAGNNNYINTTTLDQANFWPYGETFFKFPTGRFSDGRLIPDFIAEYANLPLIPPYLQPGINGQQFYYGANFASGGAGVLPQTFQGDVIDLKTQLRMYKKVEKQWRQNMGRKETKERMRRSVYTFSIGTNDYISPFLTNSNVFNSSSTSNYVGMVIGNLTDVIKEIYGRGGRKFAFINLPELGCLPAMRVTTNDGNSCLEAASLLGILHNRALSKLLIKLKKQLKGLQYSLFNMHTHLQQRMRHPSKYGFKEGERACCGRGKYGGEYSCGGKRTVKEFELCVNPNHFVFWDSFHLTEAAYGQLANHMWSAHITTVNLSQLFNA